MQSVFVLVDKETETMWFPIEQQCCTLPIENLPDQGLIGISGLYADQVLDEIEPLLQTTWAEWKETFPDTKFVRE
jgi:hypothetical protein